MQSIQNVHAWWNFADGSQMPAIVLVAVRTLNKDSTITQTFSENFSANIVQTNTFTYKQCTPQTNIMSYAMYEFATSKTK